MATELYGVNAHVSETLVQTPVTVETNIVFYGTSPSGTVGAPILITSWADAVDKLGVSVDDGYTLTDACLAAFQACNISHIYCIPVANTAEAQASDYTAALLNISDIWMQHGVIANILVAPRCQDSEVIDALVTAAKKQNGQWDGIVIYDGIQDADQLDANGRPVLTELTSAKVKTSTDDITVCHWGYAKLLSGAVISGAAFRACRWAVQDMQNNGREPSRCSGNLSVDIQSSCIRVDNASEATGIADVVSGNLIVTASSPGKRGNNISVSLIKSGATSTNVDLTVKVGSDTVISTTVNGLVGASNGLSLLNSVEGISEYVVFGGVDVISNISSSTAVVISLTGGQDDVYQDILAKKSDLDQLSADGIDSFLNIGGGKYVTWGDHTAAFNNAEIQDERGRFDNYPRMRMRITNRFEQKWRPAIDAGMDAELRRYILNEEQDFLYYLVSVQALLGSPRCEFRPQDNTKDSIAKGHFYFKDFVTYTPPAKYIDLGVSFTDEGYTVYLED